MEPLKIGNIILPHRAVFGPMAGFTDAPCRRLMAQHGAGFTVSEMVSSRALDYPQLAADLYELQCTDPRYAQTPANVRPRWGQDLYRDPKPAPDEKEKEN